MQYSADISEALSSFRNSKKVLWENKIIRHEKAIHCELAEWLVAEYLGGTRALSGNQKGWDIQLTDGRKIQVKSHAKANTNPSNWTTLSKHSEGVDEIFIVLFTPDLYIHTIYRISVLEANHICNKKWNELAWSKLNEGGNALDLEPFKIRFPFLFL